VVTDTRSAAEFLPHSELCLWIYAV